MNTNHQSHYGLAGWVLIRMIFLVLLIFILAGCAAPFRSAANIPVSGATIGPVATPNPGADNSLSQAAPEAAGTKTDSLGSAVEPAETSAPASSATGLDPDAKKAILNSLDELEKAGPYKTHTQVTAGTSKFESIAEVILPNRFHIISSGQEMLIVGPRSYIKQKGKWISFPVDVSGIVAGLRGSLRSEIANGIREPKLTRVDMVDGKPAVVYQFKEKIGSDDEQIDSQVELWIDQARGLPIRQEIDSNNDGVTTHTEQVILYDPSITIEDPNH
jgi:hypothetical protein